MCLTQCYQSQDCGHTWIELRRKCRKGVNLSNCPHWTSGQPGGPAYWPDWYFIRVESGGNCPKCDLKGEYSRDVKRMLLINRTGARLGTGAGRNKPGVDFYDKGFLCCNVM